MRTTYKIVVLSVMWPFILRAEEVSPTWQNPQEVMVESPADQVDQSPDPLANGESNPSGQIKSDAEAQAEVELDELQDPGYNPKKPVSATIFGVASSPEADIGPSAPSIRRYNMFGGIAPVPGTRRIMAEGEAPYDYKVEPGDSLYDICYQLLDEPTY